MTIAYSGTEAIIHGQANEYRSALVREWGLFGDASSTCLFIGLNPSTADASLEDATIRRCVGFARGWGFNRLLMANLFDYRATDPKEMRRAAVPSSPRNDEILVDSARSAACVIVAWGNGGGHRGRDKEVITLLYDEDVTPLCLGISKTGQPKHPLYLRRDTEPVPYSLDSRAMADHSLTPLSASASVLSLVQSHRAPRQHQLNQRPDRHRIEHRAEACRAAKQPADNDHHYFDARAHQPD